MASSSGLRHRSSANKKTPDRKKGAESEQETTNGVSPANRLFVFTIDADTARIVRFETVDENGERRELTQAEKEALIDKGNGGRIEEVIEQTFEAGIACALEDDLGESETEAAEEAGEGPELRHLLLSQLIEHSAVGHLMKSEALDRAIFGTLIQHAVATTKPQDRAASSKAN